MTFKPGDTFTFRKSAYRVKTTSRDEGGQEWVTAWRFIKTTQKYSGNAYSYRTSRILENLK